MCMSFNGNISVLTNSRLLTTRINFCQAEETDGVFYRDLLNSLKCIIWCLIYFAQGIAVLALKDTVPHSVEFKCCAVTIIWDCAGSSEVDYGKAFLSSWSLPNTKEKFSTLFLLNYRFIFLWFLIRVKELNPFAFRNQCSGIGVITYTNTYIHTCIHTNKQIRKLPLPQTK